MVGTRVWYLHYCILYVYCSSRSRMCDFQLFNFPVAIHLSCKLPWIMREFSNSSWTILIVFCGGKNQYHNGFIANKFVHERLPKNAEWMTLPFFMSSNFTCRFDSACNVLSVRSWDEPNCQYSCHFLFKQHCRLNIYIDRAREKGQRMEWNVRFILSKNEIVNKRAILKWIP